MKPHHHPLVARVGALLMAGLVVAAGSTLAQEAAKPKAMKELSAAEKKEAMQGAKVGEKAPDFVLKDTEGKEYHLSDYTKDGKAVVLEWFNPDCPFVKKHHQKNKSMAETYEKAHEQDVVWLAVNSGGPGMQGNGLERNKKAIEEYEIAYPVLLDETGKVGKMYGAKTTPHMFIIDKDGTLIYEGAIDNAPNPQNLGDVNYVNQALQEYMAGEKVENPETKSYGCSVKYAS